MSEKFMRQQPQDLAGKVCAAGIVNKTFFAAIGAGELTTTGWDEIKLPVTAECKNFVLVPRSADDAAALTEDPIRFLFSSESNGYGGIPCPGSIVPGVAKFGGDTLGYVHTGVAGLKISIFTLD